MSAPSLLQSFMAPASTQGANAAAVTVPNNEVVLLTAEEQAQQDANDLVQALEEAKCKCDELATK